MRYNRNGQFFQWILLAAILGGMILPTKPVLAFDPIALYGDEIRFDVRRDKATVGKHLTQFTREGDRVKVSSDMKLKISVLKIPVYSFSYTAVETWHEGELEQVEVAVKDGKKQKTIFAKRQGNQLAITQNDQPDMETALPILTTNHWHVDIINQNKVLNTLSGKINQIQMIAEGEETVKGKCAKIPAKRYAYTGDLKDTTVWFDSAGRWVKLQFLARDGSTITYRLNNCPKDNS